MDPRSATITRTTQETDIKLTLSLDGTGQADLDTGVPFFDHMLNQIARHGLIDLKIHAKGDTHIDAHHTVEDVGIAFGQAITQAVGNKTGLTRYGYAYAPLDEALVRSVIDLSGRPMLTWNVQLPSPTVGAFDTELVQEFFQGFVNHGRVTLHLDAIRGTNTHHIAESVFKAFGRALRMACTIDPRMSGMMPSTKGTLTD
jgi:imidazoleglycerol-phosphate dehydratase